MRILMVCTNLVFKYKDSGSKWRIDQVVELCSDHNEVIFLNALAPRDKAHIPGKGVANTYYFRQGTLFGYYLAILTDFSISFLAKLGKIIHREEIDSIFITAPYGIISASILYPSVPIVYDAHAVHGKGGETTLATLQKHSVIFRNPVSKKITKLILDKYLYLQERLACKRCAHIIAVSEIDKQTFMRKYNISEDKITVISPYLSSSRFNEVSPQKRYSRKVDTVVVLFHGTYSYPPNRDAFNLILDYIAPEIAKRDGKIRFILAGTDAPVFERENVKSLGFVEDLTHLLMNSDIAMVPLASGEGIRTKILEYMGAGLPIITTKMGIQAIEAEAGKHVIIVDNIDQSFIDAILDLAHDSKKREVLGRNALELVRAKFTHKIMQARMDEVIAKVAMYSSRKQTAGKADFTKRSIN